MTLATLEQTWREADQPYQRAHVTPYIYQNPQRFRLLSVKAEADYSYLRWTVDTAPDLAFVQAVFARFGDDGTFSWRAVWISSARARAGRDQSGYPAEGLTRRIRREQQRSKQP